MARVSLDISKLYGFKILKNKAKQSADNDLASALIDSKTGQVKIGSKIGDKIGFKTASA